MVNNEDIEKIFLAIQNEKMLGIPIRGKEIGNTTIQLDNRTFIVVDTCDTADFGFETAILVKNANDEVISDWIIVERYKDAGSAAVGHSKHIKALMSNSKELCYVDVMSDEIFILTL